MLEWIKNWLDIRNPAKVFAEMSWSNIDSVKAIETPVGAEGRLKVNARLHRKG